MVTRSKRRPKVLDAYRADVTRKLGRALGLAALLVLGGSMLSGSALVALRMEGVPVTLGRRPATLVLLESSAPSALPWALGAAGLALVFAGITTAAVGLRRIVAEERYVLLRSDGALFVDGSARRVVKWRNVESVVHEDGQLVFVCHDGSALTIEGEWGGVALPELARRAAQVRRRALFGLTR